MPDLAGGEKPQHPVEGRELAAQGLLDIGEGRGGPHVPVGGSLLDAKEVGNVLEGNEIVITRVTLVHEDRDLGCARNELRPGQAGLQFERFGDRARAVVSVQRG